MGESLASPHLTLPRIFTGVRPPHSMVNSWEILPHRSPAWIAPVFHARDQLKASKTSSFFPSILARDESMKRAGKSIREKFKFRRVEFKPNQYSTFMGVTLAFKEAWERTCFQYFFAQTTCIISTINGSVR